jgi:YegS/Rv2252/BmrU family lipid kinase
MRNLIILNHTAAKARRAWPIIQTQIYKARIEYELYETTAAGDATTKTRAALKSGTTNIAVVGGDGTLSETAEGFFEFNQNLEIVPQPINPAATLAIIPAGTGDDFARGLRTRRASLESWISAFIAHCRDDKEPASLAVDVLYGRSDGFHAPFICLNASTMGIGGETATRVAAQGNFLRRLSGEFRFLLAALGALAMWRERRVRVTVDGQTVSDSPMNLVAVANALYAGGGMMFSPEARIDDGKLDVVTASGLTRAAVIRELSRIHRGAHIKNPRVNIDYGRIVRIETFMLQDAMPIEVDGNLRGFTPVEFQVLPGALRFVV